jgi:beta-galactosidase
LENDMSTFFAADGQFWLDGEPQLIQAAEFHYFRTPPEAWRHRLGLLKAAGFNAVATYIPWRWHQLAEGESDFDGHSHPWRNLAGFLDLVSEMGFYIIARPGPYIMAETINEGIPSWVFEQYPQTAFISQDGTVQNVVSYLHPDFLACVRGWFQAVFAVLTPRQVTRGGKIILVQLDNEMGMIQWVRNIVDLNPHTLARLAEYVQAAYGPRLGDRYPAADLPRFLGETLAAPAEPYGAPVLEAYRRFYRGYLREYAEFLWKEAQAQGMEVPPIVNVHGFMNGGKTFPIGLSQLIDVMRLDGMISATDVYPGLIGEGNFHQLLMVNEITKALHNPAQALFSVEFQAGGVNDFSGGQVSLFDLHTRLCVSSGMRAINHYLFVDGENHPLLSPTKRHDWGHAVRKDGTLRAHYARYGRLSRVLSAYGRALIEARPQTVTTIGFQLDDFMTEVNNAATQEAARLITHQREDILFDMLGRGLALTHRPFDAIELASGTLDPQQTPTLWVMMEQQCDPATQQKLVGYVRGGGRLVLAGRMCVEAFDHAPCTILRDALGIQAISADPPFTRHEISAFAYRDIPTSFVETYRGDLGETVATDEQGGAVGFVKTLGHGLVLVFGAAVPAYTLDDLDLVNQMALKLDCPPLFVLSQWADVRLSQGERGSFLFINNYQDDQVETTITLAGTPLIAGLGVPVPARQGLILPLDWQVTEGVTLHYCTAEVTEVRVDGTTVVLRTQTPKFWAELSLKGYETDVVPTNPVTSQTERVKLHGHTGEMRFIRR